MEGYPNKQDPIATIYIVVDRSQYTNVLPTAVSERVFSTAAKTPTLTLPVDRLLLSWRAASYLATLPGIWAQTSLEAAHLHSLRSPDRILSFSELFVQLVCTKVPDITVDPSLRRQLLQLGVEAASKYAETMSELSFESLYDKGWEDMLSSPAFRLYVWRSQSAAFVDFFAAYEAFVFSSARIRDPNSDLSVSNRDCHKRLADLFGAQTSQRCWSGGRVSIYREVRNSIVHDSSYETKRLKEKHHNYKVVDGLVSVTIDDNKDLVKTLEGCVIELISTFEQSP